MNPEKSLPSLTIAPAPDSWTKMQDLLERREEENALYFIY